MFKVTQKEKLRLAGLAYELIVTFHELKKRLDFNVTIVKHGAKRTHKQTLIYNKKGVSRSKFSRHEIFRALDIIPCDKRNKPTWKDLKKFEKIRIETLKISKEFNFNIHFPFKWDKAHLQFKETLSESIYNFNLMKGTY